MKKDDFINWQKIHPARTIDFDTLIAGLRENVQLGYVNENTHPNLPNLSIFKYSRKCMLEAKWDIFTVSARGLVLDTVNKQVIATPFPKFFNFGEQFDIQDLATDDYVVTEKIDGSLGICFYYDNQWIICTGGSFVSDQAFFAQKWMDKHINTNYLQKGMTYLFEILSPKFRIVINYNTERLVLLAAYEKTGHEVSYTDLKRLSEYLGIEIAPVHVIKSIYDFIDIAKKLPATQEGFVIQFNNKARVKVKGDKYCELHKIVSNTTPLTIWQMLKDNQDIEKIKMDMPEEFHKDVDQIVEILNKKAMDIVNTILNIKNEYKDLTDKELGISLADLPPIVKSLIGCVFILRKNGDDTAPLEIKSIRNHVFKRIRPCNNVLQGYIPTSVMNHFRN